MTYPLEPKPSDEQKERLEDWLMELMLISRKYGIFVDTENGEVRVVDAENEHTIGLDISVLTDGGAPPKITAFDCAGSILDGVWIIDTPAGPQEQRHAGHVWPRRIHD